MRWSAGRASIRPCRCGVRGRGRCDPRRAHHEEGVGGSLTTTSVGGLMAEEPREGVGVAAGQLDQRRDPRAVGEHVGGDRRDRRTRDCAKSRASTGPVGTVESPELGVGGKSGDGSTQLSHSPDDGLDVADVPTGIRLLPDPSGKRFTDRLDLGVETEVGVEGESHRRRLTFRGLVVDRGRGGGPLPARCEVSADRHGGVSAHLPRRAGPFGSCRAAPQGSLRAR